MTSDTAMAIMRLAIAEKIDIQVTMTHNDPPLVAVDFRRDVQCVHVEHVMNLLGHTVTRDPHPYISRLI